MLRKNLCQNPFLLWKNKKKAPKKTLLVENWKTELLKARQQSFLNLAFSPVLLSFAIICDTS